MGENVRPVAKTFAELRRVVAGYMRECDLELQNLAMLQINGVEDAQVKVVQDLQLELSLVRRSSETERETLLELQRLDSLTGLYQGGVFSAEILPAFGREAAREKRHMDLRRSEWAGIWSVDCDGFKVLNDELGHPVGDKVLQATAGILTSALRKNEAKLARWGDEFGVLQAAMPGYEDIFNSVLRVRQEHLDYDWDSIDPKIIRLMRPRLSIGVVMLRMEGLRQWRQASKPSDGTLQEVVGGFMAAAFKRADDLMYLHKDEQGGSVGVITGPAWVEAGEFHEGKLRKFEPEGGRAMHLSQVKVS